MFALYLILTLNGYQCEAVAICDEHEPSCDAVVISCESPDAYDLEACLNEAAAYPAGEYNPDGELAPVYGLGCSPDATVVVFDRDELEMAL